MKERIKRFFKKKEKEKIKLDKTNKFLLIILFIVIILVCIIDYLGVLFPDFADFCLLYIHNPISGIMFFIFQFFPLKFIYVFLLLMIFLLVSFYLEFSKRLSFEKKSKYSNLVIRIEYFVLFIIILFPLMLDLCHFNSRNIESKYFEDKLDKKYTVDDLININNYFKDNILSYKNEFVRDNGEIVSDIDIVDTSINNLKNISDKYEFLKGMYPHRFTGFSKFDQYINGYSTLGVTQGFNVYVDFSHDKVNTLMTLSHELCHAKGIIRESDAEYCSLVSGFESNDKISNYGAYIGAFLRVNTALNMIDNKLADGIEDEVVQLCRLYDYKEICDFYSKDVDEYLYGTNELYLRSYTLKNYVNDLDRFVDVLSVLEKDYGCKFVIYDNKNVDVTIKDIRNRINSDSNDIVKISMNNNKKFFNKIHSFLIKNKDLFMVISQNDDSYATYDMSGEEAVKYYLKPFNENDFLLLFKGELGKEYDYERVTRLLLDYYDY